MRARLVKTTAILALGVFALAACTGQTPNNQDVPSDQGSSTASPSAPVPEEGDLAVPHPVEGEDSQAPLTGKEIGELEGEAGAEQIVPSDGKLTGQKSYFGYVPSEVEVPESVQEAFPDHHEGLAEHTLAYILGSSITVDLHQEDPTEDTVRLTYRGMETYLSAPVAEMMEEDVNSYVEAENAGDMSEPFLDLWGVAPLDPKFGGWADPNTGEPVVVDHNREWDTLVDSFEIVGLQEGHSRTDGVEIQFNRGTEIPVEGQDYDLRVYQGFNVTMTPGVAEGEWVVDGYQFTTHAIEEIDKLP